MLTRRQAFFAISGTAAGLRCHAEDASSPIELPARLNRNRQIVIPVRVNAGAPLWCMLDTGGANLLYLSPAKTADLGVAASSEAVSAGPLDTKARTGGRTWVTLDAGAVHRTNQELYIKEIPGVRDDGVIGAAVFANFIVEVDLQAPALRLHSPASFPYRDHSTPIPCDLWSSNPHILVSLTVDDQEPVKARMTVDSGAGGLADAFLTPRFDSRLRGLGRNIRWLPDKGGWQTCRIRQIAVGQAALDDALIALPPVQGFGDSADAPDGMLAVNFLRQYRLYIDYSKKQVLLERNPAKQP